MADAPQNAPKKDLAYYLTLFKIKGHSTWRAHLAQNKDGFVEQVQKSTTVTEYQTIRIDRVTGTFHA